MSERAMQVARELAEYFHPEANRPVRAERGAKGTVRLNEVERLLIRKWGEQFRADVVRIATALDQFQGEWNFDMEAAPKDGTEILLWWPHWNNRRPIIGWYDNKSLAANKWSARECLSEGPLPVAWRPLPPAPKPEER